MILLQGATAGSSNRGHFCPANDDDSCYVSGVYVVNTYFIFLYFRRQLAAAVFRLS